MALSAVTPLSHAAVKHKVSQQTHTTPSRYASKHKSSKSKGVKSRTVRRSYQQAPTPERYREIQQALVSKGYLKSEPNGEWNQDSQDALKRFQAEQNLTPDGKLNSLSLIALGLGPKRLTAQHTPSASAPPKTDTQKTEVPR